MNSHIRMSLSTGLILLALVSLVGCETCPCTSASPGLPGIPGTPGKDGRDGYKGVQGEPGIPAALRSHVLKGEKGIIGLPGPTGKNGPKGPHGPEGEKGELGLKGEHGTPGDHKRQYQSAFTVARMTAEYPAKNSPIIFTREITNDHKDYNVATGRFTCRIAGLYYFTYHVSQAYNLCVSLLVNNEIKANFCDHMSNKNQVTSGGVLVQLTKDQQVWLAVNDYNGLIGIENNDSVFSGFLIFPD